ncbi:MAG: hypothetical protein HYR62_01910 [Actinobacteria bacterium]|nr:hypothetical protein [Actinomycetota bacterium]MBI3687238.1 hypothetical protein [Actinomycetota bacterium]
MPILSLADAKAQLNITSTANDVELGDYIGAIDDAIETHVGAVLDRTVSEVVELAGYGLLVATRPVTSLTSLTSVSDGTTYDVGGLYVKDAGAGIIRRRDGLPLAVGGYAPAWTLTYVAGRGATAPSSINLAARIILQHLWETQRGGSRRPGMGGDNLDPQFLVMGFAVPRRAVELLANHQQFGVA